MSYTQAPPRAARRGIFGVRRATRPGTSPGTLIADPQAFATTIRAIGYGPDDLEEWEVKDAATLAAAVERFAVLWVDVRGLADVVLIRRLGELFGLHPLALEDVVNVHQRPKCEEYEAHLFVVTRMPLAGSERFASEQLALFLGASVVITFQERAGDRLDAVRERLRHAGRIRTQGADYLAYALVDAAIDAYFPVLEVYGERVETLEVEVMDEPHREQVAAIHGVRRELLALRRAVWPQREMVSALVRGESPYVRDSTRVFLRDCYDHVAQIMDMVETYRDITSGLLDTYLSSMSARMNDIMRVLTIIATIFIPLTFIAGIYGMNFSNDKSPWAMPELHWYYGYPLVMGVMVVLAVVMLALFRRRGWL